MTAHRILIVDDELDFGTTLAERLELRGYAAKAVSGAQEAMGALADNWRPDVVLLDLMMPGVDGLATLDLIKQHDPKIQVIILTGHGSTESGILGMQRGLFDYIMKPVDIGELIARINEAGAQ
ncbi:MAG: response regulator [Desulfurivibrionaceae bacterium]|jgi:DNA-binding response OmpR family regulator|nr:response regulator [Pseudomonadota bacterium]MDP2002348.1 response regulator [Desulfurivibrionaceae bacterium]PKN16146.1 MAG: response regulator [Deltaproteobacteria bacterium HGW-Deltaproteobacteria-3]MBU4230372.1 response regulator [Pseudomonadota bacterium]MBU4408554.1 response regulator [Pseudomonadota bacterium]